MQAGWSSVDCRSDYWSIATGCHRETRDQFQLLEQRSLPWREQEHSSALQFCSQVSVYRLGCSCTRRNRIGFSQLQALNLSTKSSSYTLWKLTTAHPYTTLPYPYPTQISLDTTLSHCLVSLCQLTILSSFVSLTQSLVRWLICNHSSY